MIDAIASHLWQSTLFAGAAALLTLAFHANQARVRYWIWLTASLKFLIPFALLTSLGSHIHVLAPSSVQQIAATTSVFSYTVEYLSQPVLSQVATPPSVSSRSALSINLLIPGVWACGVICLALIRLRAWRRIRHIVRVSLATDLPVPVEVRSSPSLGEPAVVGLIRPVLLLPQGITEHLTPSQMNAVLTHELCHVRRRDNLLMFLHMIVETVFWFHPLVWWIGARLVDERERACDEEVLRLLGEPEAYAGAILSICKRYVESPFSCVSGATGSNIKRRIEEIMNNRIGLRLTFGRKTVLALAALFVFAMPIVVGSMTAALPLPFASAVPTVPSVEPTSPQPERAAAIVQPSQGTSPQPDKPAAPVPASKPTAQEFEEASIRPCDPNNLPPAPEGMRGGGANSFQMTPGRTHALCMTLATLIRTAYGYGPADLEFLNPGGGIGPRGLGGLGFNNVYGLGVEDGVRVRGGPDWVRKERYSIEAVAQGPSDPATMQGPMLQALLARRFQLKMHFETEQIPAFALTVGRSGLKIKPVPEGSCDRLSPQTGGVSSTIIDGVHPRSFADVRRGEKPTCGMLGQSNGPNMVYVAGEVTLEALTRGIGRNLGRIQVLDKTGITDKFNFIFEFAIDEKAPGLEPSPTDTTPSDVPRAATVFTALDEQLGLRLEPAKAPRAYIVIDHVETLSPN